LYTSPYHRPELTRLPALTPARRFFRRLLSLLARLLLRLLVKVELRGLENFPAHGPALLVTNHLGDVDVLSALAFLPQHVALETLGKIDLYVEYPLPGRIMDAYGVIWLHRGQPDRKALRCAVEALQQGRIVGLSPEGHFSQTGGLEAANEGAAYLISLYQRTAARQGLPAPLPILPLTFTGTTNAQVYGALRRWRRPHITLTLGPAFSLPDDLPEGKAGLEQATEIIMRTLAAQLPPAYRGVYATAPPPPGRA
jgi:1-acyl-sn-glycerol-3-phosphate acyltransferase